ncbi:hypothetical protein WG68_14765 [Arsukibacterium ikkense]|uniref:Uncharacterized protein n=1 Tax=Arsukibacterium ikkense TaxID=336831 RepID=A0A0M2V2N9_9GAMM|nr:hypothetical protein WG68_14765 [Arsukibacterium ikkense]
MAVSSLLSLPANADPLTEALNECRQQQNALKRLVCYDEINLATTSVKPAAPARTPANEASAKATPTHGKPPALPAPAVNRAPLSKAPPAAEDFGLEHKKTADKQTDQLYLTVSSISYSPRKELIVEFDNGQTWRQTGSGNYPIAVGERHFIKRGMLNSFTLGNDDNNRNIKVRRVN